MYLELEIINKMLSIFCHGTCSEILPRLSPSRLSLDFFLVSWPHLQLSKIHNSTSIHGNSFLVSLMLPLLKYSSPSIQRRNYKDHYYKKKCFPSFGIQSDGCKIFFYFFHNFVLFSSFVFHVLNVSTDGICVFFFLIDSYSLFLLEPSCMCLYMFLYSYTWVLLNFPQFSLKKNWRNFLIIVSF